MDTVIEGSEPKKHASTPIGPKPCDDCRNAKRCRDERLGCSALVLFYHSNLNGSAARWACAPRQPSRGLYEQAMTPVKVKAPRAFRHVEDDEEGNESD